MYAFLPRPWRYAVRASISVAWGLMGAGGVAALCIPAPPLIADWGPVIQFVWGMVLVLASVSAIFGLCSNRYRWEWVASWMAAAALAPYVFVVWWMWLLGEHNRVPSASLLTALLFAVISRVVSCAAHAAKLRNDHVEAMRRLDVVEEALDDGGD